MCFQLEKQVKDNYTAHLRGHLLEIWPLSVSFCCLVVTLQCVLFWEKFSDWFGGRCFFRQYTKESFLVEVVQIDPAPMIFSLFGMDQLAYIHWHCWNKHIKVVKLPSLKVICWKLTKMWGTSVFKVGRASLYPHHTSICRILQFCGATVYCRAALFKK